MKQLDQKLKLSSVGKVSVLMALTAFSSTAMAEIRAVGDTSVAKQNGVEVVSIAAPNAAGISVNNYEKFNVGEKGAVLNNALTAGTSQLAGELNANQNLQGDAAKVILNEVISRNPSLLLGQQEVFGLAADYVLANPNGIDCDGCGFINTPRASLVVGKSVQISDDMLGYEVTGENGITTSGTITGANTLDLIAPTVTVDGDILAADNVNLVVGQNRVITNADGSTTAVAIANDTDIVLDGKLVGSIQAGRIRIHNTDTRGTVDIEGANLKATDVVAVKAANIAVRGEQTQTTSEEKSAGFKEKAVWNTQSTDTDSTSIAKSAVSAGVVALQATNDLTVSATDVVGKTVALQGDNVTLGAETATSITTSTDNNKKFLWFNNTTNTQETQTAVGNLIAAENIAVVADNDINITAAQIQATGTTSLQAKNISANGADSRVVNNTVNSYQNESAKLTTGTTETTSIEETNEKTFFYTPNLNVQADNVELGNVLARTTNTTIVADTLTTNTQANSNTAVNNVDESYWGKLGGSLLDINESTATEAAGTRLSAAQNLTVQTVNDVNLTGAQITANAVAIESTEGSVNLTSASNTLDTLTNKREGTAFDIALSPESKHDVNETNVASIVTGNNVSIKAKDSVNLTGSYLNAQNSTQVSADSINLETSTNTRTITSETNKTDFVADLTKLSMMPGVENADGEDVEFNFDFNVAGKVGTQITNTKQTVQLDSANASAIQGGNVSLVATDVNVTGSEVNATTGNVNITADSINTVAAHATNTVNINETKTFIGVDADISMTQAAAGLGVTVNNLTTEDVTNVAKASKINASNAATLAANTITHTGTQVTANELTETAQMIERSAAVTSNSNNTTNTVFNAGIKLSGKYTGSIGGELSGDITVANTQSEKTNAVASSVTANKATLTAAQVQDQATNYQTGELTVEAEQYHNYVSYSTVKADTHTVSAGANLGGGSADFINGTVSVGGEGSYDFQRVEATQAVQSNITADNLTITAKAIDSQANVNSTNAANLTADDVRFTQAENTQAVTKVGVAGNLGTGAMIIAGGSAATPTIDLSLNIAGSKSTQNTGVANTVTGGDINISATNQADLQATSLVGNNVTVAANTVNVTGVTNSANKFGLALGANANITEQVNEFGVGAGVDLTYENSATTTASTISATNSASISGTDSITLSATAVSGENVAVNTNGDLTLVAAKNNVQRNSGGVNVSLGGERTTLLAIDAEDSAFDTSIDTSTPVVDAPEPMKAPAQDIEIVNYPVEVVELPDGTVAEIAEPNIADLPVVDAPILAEEAVSEENSEQETEEQSVSVANGYSISGGSAGFKLDVADNKTFTQASIQGTNVTVNANNAVLNGSHVTAENLTGTIAGTTTVTNVQDKVFETFADISAEGSGEISDVATIVDGKLGGIDASLSFDASMKGETTNLVSGFIATNNTLVQQGEVIEAGKVGIETSYDMGMDFNVSTDLEEMKRQAVADIQAGKLPIINIDGVEAPAGLTQLDLSALETLFEAYK